ncbi:MAG: DUF547 domain-containing protein [Burkholderiales bacterium]
MPVLNPIEQGARGAAGDAPQLLAAAVNSACAAHYDAARHAFDYMRFAESPEYAELRVAARALADFDSADLRIGLRLAFWLNVYNALVLHAVIARRALAGVRAVGDFYTGSQYVIGGHVFSLDEIEHGLLRVNAPRLAFGAAPLRRDEPRYALAPYVFDERVHFAMYSACRSSPAPAAYAGAGLAQSLERASHDYLAAHVRLAPDGASLVVPKLFDWYAADFGGKRGVLEFILAHMPGDDIAAAAERHGLRLRLRYADFDWTLNGA